MEVAKALSKIVNEDSDILYTLLKETGILGYLQRMRGDNIDALELSKLKLKLEELSSTVKDLKATIAEISGSVNAISEKIETIPQSDDFYIIDKTSVHEMLNTGLELSNKFLDIYASNQDVFDLGLKVSLLISPILAYRVLLKQHMGFRFPAPGANGSGYKHMDFKKLNGFKTTYLRKFNAIALPVLGTYYGSLIGLQYIKTIYSQTPNPEISMSFIKFLGKTNFSQFNLY